MGRTSSYEYDSMHRITHVTDAEDGITTYGYDGRGNQSAITDALGYSYTYDDRGFIVGETAIESLAGYAYDDKHDGKHADGRHDDLYPHGTKHAKHDKDATFAYQIVRTDRTFTYDDAGRLLSSTETEDNYGTYTYTYEYDLMGNRTRMEKVSETGTVAEWHQYGYNESNQLVSEALYDGKKTTSLSYGYDADGNRISETGKIGTDKVQLTYEYTVENRLKAVYDADELLAAMAYDGDGNRIFQLNYNLHTDDDWKGNSGNGNGSNKDNAGSGNKSSNSGNAKRDSSSSTGKGNATNAEENNSQNQCGILFPIDSEVSDTEAALIDMIKTEGKQKNYELIEYINDVNREHTEVLVEQNINGNPDTAYIYGVERLSLDRFEGSNGYYLYDPRGSVTGITNEEGQLYQSYRYDAFGSITFGAPQYENEYTYNGESYNPNIESQYLRARYYDVVTGSFLTEDSYLGDINEPLTLNRYNYCVSSPLNYQDPSGHSSEMIDYTEIGDAVLSILGEITGDEHYTALAEENREYKEQKNYMEMSFNAGAVDSLVRSVLDPLAMAAAFLTNLDDLGHVQQEYESIMRGYDNRLAQQANGVLDMNLYYAGSCTMDVTIVVGGIVTIAYAGASAMQYFGSMMSSVAAGSGAAYATAGGGIFIEGAAVSAEGLLALLQSMGAATVTAITTTGPIGDFKNDIGKIDFDGSSEGGGATLKSQIQGLKSKTPQQLLNDGWQDITDPRMAANTISLDLYNPETGLKIRFDKGVEGASGFEAIDHYHIYNNNYTNKKVDFYLDIDGNPVGKGSKASHIVIGGGD